MQPLEGKVGIHHLMVSLLLVEQEDYLCKLSAQTAKIQPTVMVVPLAILIPSNLTYKYQLIVLRNYLLLYPMMMAKLLLSPPVFTLQIMGRAVGLEAVEGGHIILSKIFSPVAEAATALSLFLGKDSQQ